MISIRAWLNDRPIQKKLVYSNLLGSALALIPVMSIMVVYEFFALQNHNLEEVRVQAQIVAESAAAAVAFRDETAASETLAALQGSLNMIEAHLVLRDGTVLKSYYRDRHPASQSGVMKPYAGYEERVTFSAITIEKPIYLRSALVGTLVLVSSLDSFYKRMLWYLIISVVSACIGFYIASLVAIRVSRLITEPLTSLTVATQKITAEGDYSTSISTSMQDEVGSLSRAFGEMMSQIRERDFSLQQLAYYDRVTGIPNRHCFEERIEQAVGNAHRYGTSCYLLMIDLDDFKIVNDRLGHHIGDMLLRHVSESLMQTLRQNDSIFRIGGDEFAVIVESPSNKEAVGRIAKKIIQAVSQPVILDGYEAHVGASIGISCFPKLSSDVRTLMSTADTAMYIAKGRGKNAYEIYEPADR